MQLITDTSQQTVKYNISLPPLAGRDVRCHIQTKESIMSRQDRIKQQVTEVVSPIYLNVEDESLNHHVPQGAETHFKVTVVSLQFINLTRIERHRLLNKLLAEEFDLGLHALSLHLYTPEEWEKNNKTVLKSPSCRDGFNND